MAQYKQNIPCKMQCGNDPDMECETCQHRNTSYPMQVRGKSDWYLKFNTLRKRHSAAAGTVDRAKDYGAMLSMWPKLGLWSHWIPKEIEV